jgi:RimJ/RimL family protein N-acetyltransferase
MALRTRSSSAYPSEIPGEGLVLRPWDRGLLEQVAHWSARGFPYHAFDMTHLRDPDEAANMLRRTSERGAHRHFVAVQDGIAVGRIAVNLRDEAGFYIWGVHVPEEYGRRGVCRRMVDALVRWLEERYPHGPGFLLSTNAFAVHAHRAYGAVGFEIAETRWHHDRQLAEMLWKVTPQQREIIAEHIRFYRGRWEVRMHIMRRPRGWQPG